MKTGDKQPAPSRRSVLAAAALAPVLAGAGPAAARSMPDSATGAWPHMRVKPVTTTMADWAPVANVLGRSGNLLRGTTYHTPFPRDDLRVVVEGDIVITPELALGAHVAFVRYADGSTMCMGDVAVTEGELQQVIDAWQANGIAQTALHKHLPAHSPDIWWVHVHGHGHDELALARGLRAGFERTGIPPATPSGPPGPVDLDIAGIEAALGAKGSSDGVVYKAVFARRETICDGHLVLPSGLGATSAFISSRWETAGQRSAATASCSPRRSRTYWEPCGGAGSNSSNCTTTT